MLKEKYPQRIERWKQPCFSVWGLGVSLKRSGGTIFKMSSSKFLPLVHMLLLLQGLGSTQQRMWTTMCGSAGTGSKNNVGVGSCCCPANLALCCLKNHLQTGESLRVFWWKHRQEDTKPCIKSSCWGAELRGECHGDGSQSWVFFEAAFLSPSTHLILGSRRMSGRKKEFACCAHRFLIIICKIFEHRLSWSNNISSAFSHHFSTSHFLPEKNNWGAPASQQDAMFSSWTQQTAQLCW